MRSPLRRPLLILLALVIAGTVAPVSSVGASAYTTAEISEAERAIQTLINRKRADRSLVGLKWDQRVADLARARAAYMAETGRFSHQQAGGDDVFDMIDDSGMTWYGAGEIIAWNNVEDLDRSAAFAVDAWMGSRSHRAIVVSSGYNYVGFGMAAGADGRRYWAGVFLKGPDRTGAWTKLDYVAKRVVDEATTKVYIRWDGNDTKLQVLTSGLRHYEIARRINGGDWVSYGTTTAETATRYWPRGSTIDFRIRARDRAGNWGSWRTVTITP
ncbi:MAG: CAP domain-containing protein [Candidatus Limnocylindria bacterium]